MVSLCVYKDGDWLQLGTGSSNRYDSINTLVMRYAIGALPIPVGDHVVLTYLRYPLHSSQYYKSRTGFTTRDNIPVKLTNQLIPDK